MTDTKTLWESAGKAGLVLGAVPVAYSIIGTLMSKIDASGSTMAALGISVFSAALWAVKFVACIYLMRMFMKKFAATDPDITNSQTFGFGTATALLSALIVAAYSLANVLFISPDAINEAFDTMMQSYSSMLDSNSLDAIDSVKNNMPSIQFFGTFIWCFLFGTVLSAILSRNIPSNNPFSKEESDDE